MQPTFLYELIWNLLVAALVVWADRRFRLGHGRAFAVYVAGYTAGRFVIEQMRTDYATRVFGDIRINVVVAAVVCVGALVYLAVVRKPREVLEGAPPRTASRARGRARGGGRARRRADQERQARRAGRGMTGFAGFGEGAVDFYDGLEADNSKAYWTDHRAVYENDVKAPMLALLAACEAEFGPGKIFRPYRDVRFSNDKTPYKTHCGATAGPYYVHIGPDGLMAAGGYYMMAPDQVARFRTAVDDDRRGDDLVKRLAAVEAEGVTIAGEQLKTRPRGVDPEHPRLDADAAQGPLRPPRLAARRRAARGGCARARGRDVAGGAAARRVVGRPRGPHRAAPR